MPSPVTRRRFLRDSALVSGGALLVGLDPSSASAAPSTAPVLSAAGRLAAAPGRHHGRSDGAFALLDHGDPGDDFLLRWTRAGGSASLELTPDVVRLDVPIFGVEEIDLADFAQGRGEHEIERYFGSAALEQLRNEVTYRRVPAT